MTLAFDNTTWCATFDDDHHHSHHCCLRGPSQPASAAVNVHAVPSIRDGSISGIRTSCHSFAFKIVSSVVRYLCQLGGYPISQVIGRGVARP